MYKLQVKHNKEQKPAQGLQRAFSCYYYVTQKVD